MTQNLEKPGELAILPMGEPSLLETVVLAGDGAEFERLVAWCRRAATAYPANTLRAWRADWAGFRAFCAEQGRQAFPADSETIAAYVEHCAAAGKKPATVRRYLASLARPHRVAKVVNPCDDELVQMAVREMLMDVGSRQRQARGLSWEEIKKFADIAGQSLQAIRERALLGVGYDGLLRRSELVGLNVDDIAVLDDGTGRALIRRSKTDQIGQGETVYLARTTVRWLKAWWKKAKIRDGAAFRRLVAQRGAAVSVGERLSPHAIAAIYKRVAKWIELPADAVAAVSGHSLRVGATQDLLALDMDLPSVMQAGRWKTPRMPARYGEHLLAGKGAIARAAVLQGRDKRSTKRGQDSKPEANLR